MDAPLCLKLVGGKGVGYTEPSAFLTQQPDEFGVLGQSSGLVRNFASDKKVEIFPRTFFSE